MCIRCGKITDHPSVCVCVWTRASTIARAYLQVCNAFRSLSPQFSSNTKINLLRPLSRGGPWSAKQQKKTNYKTRLKKVAMAQRRVISRLLEPVGFSWLITYTVIHANADTCRRRISLQKSVKNKREEWRIVGEIKEVLQWMEKRLFIERMTDRLLIDWMREWLRKNKQRKKVHLKKEKKNNNNPEWTKENFENCKKSSGN